MICYLTEYAPSKSEGRIGRMGGWSQQFESHGNMIEILLSIEIERGERRRKGMGKFIAAKEGRKEVEVQRKYGPYIMYESI